MAPATVTDKKGKSIDGLTEPDFLVLDDGVPRKPSLEYTLSPISLVLVVEANVRSAGALKKVQRIGSLIQPLVLGERGAAAVVTFADGIRLWQDFTPRPEILGSCLKKLEPQGKGGRMYDAVAKAVDLLVNRKDPARRRVVILVSEPRDAGSKARLDELVKRVQEENILVYPLTYSSPLEGVENPHEALARFTGGEQLPFSGFNGLERAIAKLAEDLHRQYLLSFLPTGAVKADYHRIEIRVPSRPDALIRTRPGYWDARVAPASGWE